MKTDKNTIPDDAAEELAKVIYEEFHKTLGFEYGSWKVAQEIKDSPAWINAAKAALAHVTDQLLEVYTK